jgi:succinoglycan biosynthesis transport protein ExoP
MSVNAISQLRRPWDSRVIAHDEDLTHTWRAPDERMVLACRSAVAALDGASVGSLAIASSLHGEGRTSIAAAFATILARDYRRSTLLLELDHLNPSVAGLFGLRQGPGLTELLRGEVTLDDVIQPASRGMSVITSGGFADESRRTAAFVARLLSQLHARFDVVVGDLPPLLVEPASRSLVRAFEESILVVRAGSIPVKRVREAVQSFDRQPVVLLNGVSDDR